MSVRRTLRRVRRQRSRDSVGEDFSSDKARDLSDVAELVSRIEALLGSYPVRR
jgi:hypothetical protein